jgi:glycosyltransferase involved in cell wall biosynthesis
MHITVILCTYNRCQSLARALDSIAVSVVPKTIEWEVLVVDNNSSDQTEAVVKDFSHRFRGRFRYLFEPRQGKSYALNSGIGEARGDILVFVDDDVIVEPEWLQNLTSALHDSELAGCGGRILPQQGFVPPNWLALDGPYNLVGALCAYFDLGDVSRELRDPPFGANMAFRKEMFARYGDFRTDLGPFPDNKIGFEDTEFGRRLMAAGERLQYIPTAVVYHEVPDYRVRKEFLLKWWFDFGRGSVRQTQRKAGTAAILKILGRAVLTAVRWALSFDSQRRFYLKCRIWYAAGKIVEICHQADNVNSPRQKLARQAGGESRI